MRSNYNWRASRLSCLFLFFFLPYVFLTTYDFLIVFFFLPPLLLQPIVAFPSRPSIMSTADPLPNMTLGMEWDEALSQCISLGCISALSTLFGAKTSSERIRHMTYARLLILLVYGASWVFTTASTILVATNNYNEISCTLSILTCVTFYAGSKILIYAWYVFFQRIYDNRTSGLTTVENCCRLIERIWVVQAVKTKRLRTPLYRFHLCLLVPYFVIFSLMVIIQMLILFTFEIHFTDMMIMGFLHVKRSFIESAI